MTQERAYRLVSKSTEFGRLPLWGGAPLFTHEPIRGEGPLCYTKSPESVSAARPLWRGAALFHKLYYSTLCHMGLTQTSLLTSALSHTSLSQTVATITHDPIHPCATRVYRREAEPACAPSPPRVRQGPAPAPNRPRDHPLVPTASKAHTHTRTRARTHTRTQALAHALAHARTHARPFVPKAREAMAGECAERGRGGAGIQRAVKEASASRRDHTMHRCAGTLAWAQRV